MEYNDYVELRDKYGYKDAEVARAIGINRVTFADWKSGKSKPKIDKIEKIEQFFREIDDHTIKNFDEDTFGETMKGAFDMVMHGQITPQIESYLKNDMLRSMLFAGGKIVDVHPEVIEAVIYTLEKMGEKK